MNKQEWKREQRAWRWYVLMEYGSRVFLLSAVLLLLAVVFGIFSGLITVN